MCIQYHVVERYQNFLWDNYPSIFYPSFERACVCFTITAAWKLTSMCSALKVIDRSGHSLVSPSSHSEGPLPGHVLLLLKDLSYLFIFSLLVSFTFSVYLFIYLLVYLFIFQAGLSSGLKARYEQAWARLSICLHLSPLQMSATDGPAIRVIHWPLRLSGFPWCATRTPALLL